MDSKAVSKEVAVVPLAAGTVSLGTLQAANPRALVEGAAEIAGVLARVIKSRGLSVTLEGRQYVKVEGWTTLAIMLGVVAREVETREEFGVYTAIAELVRMSDGAVISRASAECGDPDEVNRRGEPTWANRPRFARRSMAQTRSVGKACRLAFSWIMALGGYETCPAEEMEAALTGNTTGSVRESTGSVVSAAQVTELRRLIAETKASESRFCAYLKVRALEELPLSRFEISLAALSKKGTSKEVRS